MAEQSLQRKVTTHRHGAERQPVVVIDHFLPHPEALVTDACSRSFKPIGPYYPGLRSPADPNHLASAGELLESVLREVFGITRGVRLVECHYSLVTTPPDELAPIQRLPHFDTTDPGRIALLHFLCGAEHGGTRFYRHRQTGFETVTSERFARYREALHREAADAGLPPARYCAGDTRQFEQIAAHQACFNRALVYRGFNLHSGFIPESMTFTADPAAGRLTVNTFLDANS